jgi:hypothetical protein
MKQPYARYIRNEYLKESDWTQLPDADLTASQKAAWAAYRQALRDLPASHQDGELIDWPQKPST